MRIILIIAALTFLSICAIENERRESVCAVAGNPDGCLLALSAGYSDSEAVARWSAAK